MPTQYRSALPDLMARLEPLPVVAETPARVVINERTGTVVVGGNVRIAAAAVAHGNLSVRISTQFEVSQPNAAVAHRRDRGRAATRRSTCARARRGWSTLEEGTTLDAVVRALNTLGATPRDIIAIMQALKAAGALRAEIVII